MRNLANKSKVSGALGRRGLAYSSAHGDNAHPMSIRN